MGRKVLDKTSTRQIKKGCQHKDLYITSCLHGQKSTRQIKKICQDRAQNCLQGKDKRKTKYSVKSSNSDQSDKSSEE